MTPAHVTSPNASRAHSFWTCSCWFFQPGVKGLIKLLWNWEQVNQAFSSFRATSERLVPLRWRVKATYVWVYTFTTSSSKVADQERRLDVWYDTDSEWAGVWFDCIAIALRFNVLVVDTVLSVTFCVSHALWCMFLLHVVTTLWSFVTSGPFCYTVALNFL